MQPDHYHFRFEYRPVGQGLFSVGTIWNSHYEYPDFTWVYDCGSSDSPASLSREIDRLKNELESRKRLDVLILSHFDRDHINGVKELMKHFRVDRLFIPYVPLEKRLLLAFGEPILDREFIEVLANPARHLVEAGGDNLGQIIYVVGGDHDEPPEAIDVIEGPPASPFEPTIKYPRYREEIPAGETTGEDGAWRSKILYVSDKEPFTLPGLWEFIFFNKEENRATDAFVAEVTAVVDQWKWGEWWTSDPEAFVSNLKSIYERQFPQGRPRNDISLVTYAGPISDSWAKCHSCVGDLFPAHRPLDLPLLSWNHCGGARTQTKASHLYLGDLTLTKTLLQKKLKPHLGNERWDRILGLQVPHHGAKGSWFKNASICFHHESSIFSYGMKNGYKHPGDSVMEDLRCHRPMLVNELQGALFCGRLTPKSIRLRNRATVTG